MWTVCYSLYGESIYSICPWGYFHQGGQYHIYGVPATDRSGSKDYSGHNQQNLEHLYHGIPVCSNQSLLHTLITVAYNFYDCVHAKQILLSAIFLELTSLGAPKSTSDHDECSMNTGKNMSWFSKTSCK